MVIYNMSILETVEEDPIIWNMQCYRETENLIFDMQILQREYP